MQYMISFALTSKDYTERVNRFLDTGALPPEGATMLGRWISVAHDHGYILAETDDPGTIFKWVSMWCDVMDFQVQPVVGDDVTGPILSELREAAAV